MRRRTQSRDKALKILYQVEITKKPLDEVSNEFWSNEKDDDQEVKEFCQRLVSGTIEHKDKIDEKISQYAANWELKRMAIIDRNVLRLGVFELLYAPDIPPKATINEAVELAKMYGDVESSKFVNGILDKVHKTDCSPGESS